MREPQAKGVIACKQIYPRAEQAERPDKSKVSMAEFSEGTEDTSFEEKRAELERRLDWLFKEVDRLKRENERLKSENKELREEVTLLRLAQESDWTGALTKADLPTSLSQEAINFYRELPGSLNFAVYFRIADEHGISSATAKNYLLHFIQEGMMVQKGHRIEKSERAASQFGWSCHQHSG